MNLHRDPTGPYLGEVSVIQLTSSFAGWVRLQKPGRLHQSPLTTDPLRQDRCPIRQQGLDGILIDTSDGKAVENVFIKMQDLALVFSGKGRGQALASVFLCGLWAFYDILSPNGLSVRRLSNVAIPIALPIAIADPSRDKIGD